MDIGLEDPHEYENYMFVLTRFEWLYSMIQRQPYVTEIGLEDVYQ